MNLWQTFHGLMNNWSDAFQQQRTFDRARRLGLALLLSVNSHRISNAICATGRQFESWSSDYRFFSDAKWDPHRLFDPVFDHLPSFLPSPDAPVFGALDDTILKKTGRHIPGVRILRDPMSPPFHVNFVYGLRFVQASVLVSPPGHEGAARALPVRFDPAPLANKPKKNASEEDKNLYREEKKKLSLSQAGVAAIHGVRESLNAREQTRNRRLVISGDGSYTNRTVLRNLPANTTLIGRIRKDAKLAYPLPPASSDSQSQPEDKNKKTTRGRKRLYGSDAPTPQQIWNDESIPWEYVSCFAAGQWREMPVKAVRHVYWRKSGPDMPLMLVVIKPLAYRNSKSSKLQYRNPAFLICTDPEMDLATLIQAYVDRWEIECNHRDEKSILKVGQPQVWNEQSVRRVPQFQVASYSLLTLAALQSSGFQRTGDYLPLPAWRRKPARASTLDQVALMRDQAFAAAVDSSQNYADFVPRDSLTAKSSKFPMAADTLCTLAA